MNLRGLSKTLPGGPPLATDRRRRPDFSMMAGKWGALPRFSIYRMWLRPKKPSGKALQNETETALNVPLWGRSGASAFLPY
jgi:hypothetical protein